MGEGWAYLKRGMRNGLRVGGHDVVVFVWETNVS